MKKQAGVITLALVVAMPAALLVRHKQVQQDPPATSSPIVVEVRRLVSASTRLTLQAIADVEPVREVLLNSRMLGHVTALPLSEGDRFRKGQLLVRLDPGPQGKSATRNAADQIGLLEAEARAAQAQMTAEQERLHRTRALFEIQGASLEQVQSAEAAQAAAASRLSAAHQNLGSAVIYAPFDGVVSARLAQTGDTVTPGKALLKIHDGTQGVRILVHAPQNISPKRMHMGDREFALQPWPEAGPGGTRKFEARAPGSDLIPGTRIPVRLEIHSQAQGILIPHDCMLSEAPDQALILALPIAPPAASSADTGLAGVRKYQAQALRVTLAAQAEEGGVASDPGIAGRQVACGSPDVLARLLAGVPFQPTAQGS